jgi:hypothetical protein
VRRTPVLALPALLLTLALAQGCGGSDDPGSDPGTTGSSPATSSASPSESPSESAATGIRLQLANSAVRAPQGWTHASDLTRFEDGADSPDSLSYVMLGEINAFGSQASAEELARNRIKANLYPKAPEVLPVTDLAGTPAYHVAGFVTGQQYLEEFGTIVRDRIVTLTFSFNRKVPAEERRQVVEQVLPTFTWK